MGRTRCSTPFDVAIVKPAPREPRIPHEAPPLPRREAARAVREALAEEERQHGVAVVDLAQLAVPAKEHAVQPLRAATKFDAAFASSPSTLSSSSFTAPWEHTRPRRVLPSLGAYLVLEDKNLKINRRISN